MSTARKFFYDIIAFILRLIFRINGGLEIVGKENIPSEGGVLIAANHISYLDPPVIGCIMPPRRSIFMARKGLFDIPVLSWIIKGAAFPVDREKTQPSTIKETVRRLRRGELITLFPEGRRSDTGELMEGKKGVGMLISLSKVPVVPTLLKGTDKVLPVDAKWLKRAKITVVFGKPIYYNPDNNTLRGHELYESISNQVMTAIKELQIQHGN